MHIDFAPVQGVAQRRLNKMWSSSIFTLIDLHNHPAIMQNVITTAMRVKVSQSCLTLCDPMDYIVNGILQVQILCVQLFPSPGDVPNPRLEPRSHALQMDSLPAEPQGKPNYSSSSSNQLITILLMVKYFRCIIFLNNNFMNPKTYG